MRAKDILFLLVLWQVLALSAHLLSLQLLQQEEMLVHRLPRCHLPFVAEMTVKIFLNEENVSLAVVLKTTQTDIS